MVEGGSFSFLGEGGSHSLLEGGSHSLGGRWLSVLGGEVALIPPRVPLSCLISLRARQPDQPPAWACPISPHPEPNREFEKKTIPKT